MNPATPNSVSASSAAASSYNNYYQAKSGSSSHNPLPNPAVSPNSYKVIDIGTQFCRQYYKMLSVEPEAGYKFYSKHSYLTHGLEGDLDAPVCFGLEDIQQRLLSMGFAGCRVFISTIDCQASHNGSVMVVVIGRMHMKGGESRKFVQSIFLAEQPTGFFVLNDVFRFIDTEEMPSPIQLPSAAPVPSPAAPLTASPPQPVSPHHPPAPIQSPVKPLETGSWGDSSWVVDAAVSSFSQPKAAVPSPIKPQSPSPSALAKTQGAAAKKDAPASRDNLDVCMEAAKPASSSWVKVTQDQQSKWENGLVSEAKGTSNVTLPTAPKEAAKQEARQFKLRRNPAAHNGGNGAPETSKTEQEGSHFARPSGSFPSTPSTAPPTYRPRRQYNDNFNADASIFVSGLKGRVEKNDAKELFSKYGEVKEVDVAREFLFVEFATAESAQRAIQDGTAMIAGSEVKINRRRPPRPHPVSKDEQSSGHHQYNRFQARTSRQPPSQPQPPTH